MRGWFLIIISILLIPLVFAADNPSQDERYNNILEKLKRGEIDTESIRIISQGIPSENQEAFIGAIGELKEGKEKVFWDYQSRTESESKPSKQIFWNKPNRIRVEVVFVEL